MSNHHRLVLALLVLLSALALLALTWRPHFNLLAGASAQPAHGWSLEIEGQVIGSPEEVRLIVELPEVKRRQEFAWNELEHKTPDHFLIRLQGVADQVRPRQLLVLAQKPGFADIRVGPGPTELIPPLRLEFRR